MISFSSWNLEAKKRYDKVEVKMIISEVLLRLIWTNYCLLSLAIGKQKDRYDEVWEWHQIILPKEYSSIIRKKKVH